MCSISFLRMMLTKKDTMRTCVHGVVIKHIAFRVIYIITYFAQKVNIFVGFMMIFVKSSGRGIPAAVVFGRLESLEDLVRRAHDGIKRRLEGFELSVMAPSCDVAKRIVRRVQSQSAAYDIRHRFSLHFARATVCIRFFGTLGMQERVSDLMDSCLYPLHLGQAVSDDNALVSVAVVAVGSQSVIGSTDTGTGDTASSVSQMRS